MWQWECRKAHKQPGSTLKNKAYRCPSSLHKRSPTKRGHLYRECGHRRSTCRYLHQATWWEDVLQAKEWIEHTWLLQYVLMHPQLYDMPLLRAIQDKNWLAWHTSLLRTWLVHLDIFCISNRLIHENQMNLIFVWYHYCFYTWLVLVVAYDMFVGL